MTILDKVKLPAVTIAALDAGPIDEGETAVFTLSASPNPISEIMVSVEVDHAPATTGDFINLADKKIHQVPVSIAGSGRLEVRTVSDAVSEASGSIQATLKADPMGEDDESNVGRTTSTTYLVDGDNDSTTVAITDNDHADKPSITISGLDTIDEGATATFTLTAEPVNNVPVLVSFRITRQGNFFTQGFSETETITRTIPHDGDTPGQLEISESTITDAIDEEDGSITLRILSDPESTDFYSVGATSIYKTRVIDDDDSNLPNITISGGAGIEESTSAEFTITATRAGSNLSVDVRVQVSETGNFLANPAGIRTISVAVGNTTNLTENLDEDDYDEVDGSITATILKDIDGNIDYGIGTDTSATIQVSDNDDPPAMSISIAPVTEGNDPSSNANMVFTVDIDQTISKRNQR